MVLWVFGYGSIIWNPGFDFEEKLIGYIKDYKRWGAAYCVHGGPEKEKLAMEYLERRECEYDSKTLVEFYTKTDTSEPILTGVILYVNTRQSVEQILLLEEMAMQIATASGPFQPGESNLCTTLHEEEFVIELANEVRNTAKLAKGSEGIVETCGFSCTHPSKLSLKLNFHISYPINN
ncbi:hypothetical protein HID58_023494 [Brassica napus]|uniref:Gamma-glutamylcyclotransferase n=1 Tax=Brassica napus TaxID=3708 RepID=A0ABQ8D291_BRANA|nr:hypothetical protein HID58_023494 [Brassica napus]